MRRLNRRSLLKGSILGPLAVGGASVLPRRAWAAPWAELPDGSMPPGYQPKKVLEIFCYSGMSQWETFWVSEEMPGTKNWRNFQPGVQGMHWHCAPDMPSPSDETLFFAKDEGGVAINWGPSTKPLWRPDIFNRARMVTLAHELDPHEAAVPLGLTGHRLGNPRMAGLGSAIQRRLNSIQPRTMPYSYVLTPDDIGGYTYVEQSAVANGMHPGSAVPILIKIGDASFAPLLQRSQMTKEADQLLATYQAMYRDGLRFQGMGDAIRSAGFSSYDTAVNFLLHAGDLYGLLSANNILTVPDGPVCASNAAAQPADVKNKTKTALDLATLLLTAGDAGYVCVLDGGVRRENSQISPYDTHGDKGNDMLPGQHIEVTSANVFNLCRCLADQIDANDPTKLNLDDVLIVIRSEFGRTPDFGVNGGRDHFPYGYAAILIGGPISSRGIRGHLEDWGGAAPMHDYSPTDVHGAVLMAAGIDPFAAENFGVADFSGNVLPQADEDGGRAGLRCGILGVNFNCPP